MSRRAWFYWKRSAIGPICGVTYDRAPQQTMEQKEAILLCEEITDDPELYDAEHDEPRFGALAKRFPSPGAPRGRSQLPRSVPSDPSEFDEEPPAGPEEEPSGFSYGGAWILPPYHS